MLAAGLYRRARTQKALAVARAALPAYSCVCSKKDFTQHQLFAILALKTFLKTSYRGIEALLTDWSDLRNALKIKKVPHYTTIQKLAARLKKKNSTRC